MNLKNKVVWLVAALALAALPVMQAAAKGSYYYDFSTSLKPWSSASDSGGKQFLQLLTEDDPGGERVSNTYAQLAAGEVKYQQESVAVGVPLPVGNWALASYPSDGKMVVRARLDARSGYNCEGCILKVYVGNVAPQSITQFSDIGRGSALKTYWQNFSYEARAGSNTSGEGEQSRIYIAFGWSGSDAAIAFDNIDLDIFPAP